MFTTAIKTKRVTQTQILNVQILSEDIMKGSIRFFGGLMLVFLSTPSIDSGNLFVGAAVALVGLFMMFSGAKELH